MIFNAKIQNVYIKDVKVFANRNWSVTCKDSDFVRIFLNSQSFDFTTGTKIWESAIRAVV